MSDADALMWNIEKDPQLRSTIVAVMVLDQVPDWPALRERIEAGDLVDPPDAPAGGDADAAPRPSALVGGSRLRSRLPPASAACPLAGNDGRRARDRPHRGNGRVRPRPAPLGVHRDRRPRRRALGDDHQGPPLHDRRRRWTRAADGIVRPRTEPGRRRSTTPLPASRRTISRCSPRSGSSGVPSTTVGAARSGSYVEARATLDAVRNASPSTPSAPLRASSAPVDPSSSTSHRQRRRSRPSCVGARSAAASRRSRFRLTVAQGRCEVSRGIVERRVRRQRRRWSRPLPRVPRRITRGPAHGDADQPPRRR